MATAAIEGAVMAANLLGSMCVCFDCSAQACWNVSIGNSMCLTVLLADLCV